MPLKTIVGDLFTRYTKIINHLHKDSNDFLSVTIILETDVHGGETVFLMERL